jgi:hypothetical protein
MKLMYFLCKEELPHSTIFNNLVCLVKDLGVDVLSFLDKGGNAKYTSERHMQELVLVFGKTVWEPIRQDLLSSPFYSVMVDETTDVDVKNELIMYIRFLKDGKSATHFARIVDIPDGKAHTIKQCIVNFLQENNIPLQRMCALGSDGLFVCFFIVA